MRLRGADGSVFLRRLIRGLGRPGKRSANIESYHRQQLETGFETVPARALSVVSWIRPIERVGTVPGGTAAYPYPPFS